MKKLPFCKHRKTVEGCLYCPENDGTRARHTPTPWKHDGQYVFDADGHQVLNGYNLSKKLLDKIIRAVNAHDELVSALKRAEAALSWFINDDGESDVEALEEVKAAIAKVEAR